MGPSITDGLQILRTLYQLMCIECQVSLASCRVPVHEGVERNDRGGGASVAVVSMTFSICIAKCW